MYANQINNESVKTHICIFTLVSLYVYIFYTLTTQVLLQIYLHFEVYIVPTISTSEVL